MHRASQLSSQLSQLRLQCPQAAEAETTACGRAGRQPEEPEQEPEEPEQEPQYPDETEGSGVYPDAPPIPETTEEISAVPDPTPVVPEPTPAAPEPTRPDQTDCPEGVVYPWTESACAPRPGRSWTPSWRAASTSSPSSSEPVIQR